ncbi:MAG: hypothetical protein WCI34_03990 [Actinomycetes bacterium]
MQSRHSGLTSQTHTAFRETPSLKEVVLVGLGYLWLSVDQAIPLLRKLGDVFPGGIGDPLPQAWQIAWGGHALVNRLGSYWDANQYWPLHDTLAFSDSLSGYAPLGLIGTGPHAATIRYNLTYIIAWALPAFGAYLLARMLSMPLGPSLVVGVAYCYAPWRLGQAGHLHVLSEGGIPLSLALFIGGVRFERWKLILAGSVVAAWQITIGFSLGVPFLYLLFVLAATTLAVPSIRRTALRTPAMRRSTILGAMLVCLAATTFSLPYMRVLQTLPEAQRSAAMVYRWSPPASSFLVASDKNLLWGGPTSRFAGAVPNTRDERSLFPGVVAILLAAVGMGWGAWARRRRFALAGSTAFCALLSLGFGPSGWRSLLPYRVAFSVFPGWDASRTPGRLTALTSLGIALLAGLGASVLLSRLLSRHRGALAPVLAVLLCVLLVAEGTPIQVPTVPSPRSPFSNSMRLEGPILELPASQGNNRSYLLWSTQAFPNLVNGRSSVEPRYFNTMLQGIRKFPSLDALTLLRRKGVRTVLVHRDAVRAKSPEVRLLGPVLPTGASLPPWVSRSRSGELDIYRMSQHSK